MIQKDYDLRHLNTFGISCVAAQYAEVHDSQQLRQLLEQAKAPEQLLLLGGGSNVILPDYFPGLVLRNCIEFIDVLEEQQDDVLVSIGAGVNWHQLVLWTIRQGYSGLENMALIPGTVGASPIQNIGAYGVELKDVLEELTAINLQTGKERRFSREDCQFGYRDSVFKQKKLAGKFYLNKVILRLKRRNHQLKTSYGAIQSKLVQWKIDKPKPADVAAAVIEIRRSKLPDWRKYGNAGSFFKNPIISLQAWETLKSTHPTAPSYPVDAAHIKVPAGWLIDQCGWKGKRTGPVGCYEHQALVIVNHGGATSQDILTFSEDVMLSVFDRFGIQLEREVRLVG